MISDLHLGHLPSYHQEAAVRNLETINFIFGPNGSGKTSATRLMDSDSHPSNGAIQWRVPEDVSEVCVYNKYYTNKILHSSTTMPGVFALGGDSAASLKRIDELSSEKGEIAKARSKRDGLRAALTGTGSKPGPLARLQKAESDFETEAWKVRQALDPEIRKLLKGNIGTKQLFSKRVLAEPLEGETDESATESSDLQRTLTEIKDSVLAITENDDTSDQDLALVSLLHLEGHIAHPLYPTPVVSTANTSLARALREKGSIDWAVQGIPHLGDSKDCPMCLRPLGEELLESILGLSDKKYEEEIAQLEAFSEMVTRKQGMLTVQLESIGKLMPTSPELTQTLDAIDHTATELRNAVARKGNHPSETVALPDVDSALSKLNDLVKRENSHRRKRREQRATRKATLESFEKQAWHAIAHHLGAHKIALDARKDELSAAITKQRERIAEAETSLASLEGELVDRRNSIRTHRPWMDKVNELLANVGFTTFHFEEASTFEGGYTLVRDDGSPANDTLSEGERTFVSFMYFISSLDSVGADSIGEPRVAVFDDPIASLDSDVLFLVSALIKKLLLQIHKHETCVVQAFVLTHNIHFLKEVSYLRSGEGTAPRAFYVLSKTEAGTHVSERKSNNPVEVEYVRLWRQIGEWRGTSGSDTGLQNAMRRVIEYYFQTIGRVNESALVSKFSGDDQIIVKSFFSWINEGSHSLFDGLHFAPTSATSDKYFEVFERLFSVSGNEGHFEMMSSSWN